MIQLARSVTDKFPMLAAPTKLLSLPARALMEKIHHGPAINDYLDSGSAIGCIDFVDQLFEQFNFTYQIAARDRQNIPDYGRAIIIANQPYTPLHALAVFRLVSEVRNDVKLVLADGFANCAALAPAIIHNAGNVDQQQDIIAALNNEEAVIIFPSTKSVPGRTNKGKHQAWRPEFLHYCRSTGTPVLPIFLQPQKRLRRLSHTLLLKAQRNTQRTEAKLCVGELIAADALLNPELNDKALTARLRKHLFKLARKRGSTFVTVKTIAHPESRAELQRELEGVELLGSTRDNNAIYLADFNNPSLMREIGRMREISFRKVGEGTGSKRDLDEYDRYYHHLILWNRQRLELAGAYRIGHTHSIINTLGVEGLYTHSLFEFTEALSPYLTQTIELGRSFVAPNYWGKNSLDYLWQGIGAYINRDPDIRYVLGPVTISAGFSRALTEEMVFYYQRFYNHSQTLAVSRMPFTISSQRNTQLEQKYLGCDREQGFKLLQQSFTEQGKKIPVLFKQYAALYEEGGFKLLAFNVDPNFSDCIDGLFIADLHQLKAAKRKRYLGQ
ncbi:lysophospholipid acyltransferase family protein [Halioxenophilus aromaticivorans]|uniref:L-ornithine N(alpha)-acyltransferase n=1 Tax=Halioxenophilus aromaticivorans TaxID=1306992 RepID=A0AAV3U257_9ALTE